ncbi:MAG: gliding motility protein GldC [Ignavibacteriaceae bacterium]|nr:gliding motility protein GldC [Ignavibacteriaceae bacterium]
MPRNTEIKVTVQLDDNKIPEKIEWEAEDSGFRGKKEAKTLLISLWDKQENVTLGIDLWTKEMKIDEMNIHMHQILIKLADMYRRSTNNKEGSDLLEKFSSDFAGLLNLKTSV